MNQTHSRRSIIGSILFFIYMVTYTLLYGIMFFVLCPFISVAKRQALAFTWCACNLRMLTLLCGVRYQIEGTEHLPNCGAIIMAKHQSAWETFAIPTMIQPRQMCIVYKRELHLIPFFGWGIKMLNMVPIDRSHGVAAFEQIKQKAGARLKEGAWMMFFPEGTRVPVGFKKPYKTGGSRLSLATGAPIVPVAHNAGECWPRGSFWKHPGLITLRYGPPIDPTGHTVDSLNKAIETWIETQMHEISPHRYQGPETPLYNNKQ
jgi:1-acyl-sn-glycerol-3-phosphate acyltransferase